VVDLKTAAHVLGIGRTAAYELVRAGQWPTPVLRLGRLIKVPTAPLLELVGVADQEGRRQGRRTNDATSCPANGRSRCDVLGSDYGWLVGWGVAVLRGCAAPSRKVIGGRLRRPYTREHER